MTVVAICTAGGSSGATTTAVFAAGMLAARAGVLLAECDQSGGDLAAWAQLPLNPGWSTAVAGHDRSFDGLIANTQQLPSGLSVVTAPARCGAAAATVPEAATMFGAVLAARRDVITVADCGRVGTSSPAWVPPAALTLLVVRQVSATAAPNVAVVDRALEALDLLSGAARKIGVVLIGDRPYPPAEIEAALGAPLFALLPEDRHGASVALGGWTLGRRDRSSSLARAAEALAARIAGVVGHVATAPLARPKGSTGRSRRRRRPSTGDVTITHDHRDGHAVGAVEGVDELDGLDGLDGPIASADVADERGDLDERVG